MSQAPHRRTAVLQAFRHEPPERLPYHVEMTGELRDRVAAQAGVAPGEIGRWLGNYCDKADIGDGGALGPDGIFRDDFGVEWDRSGADKDIGIVRRPRIADPAAPLPELPAPDVARARARVQAALARGEDVALFAKLGTTLFERAWSLCGLENFLMCLLAEPDFAAELLRRVCDHRLALVEAVLDLPVDGFYFGDDYGQQGGALFGLDAFRTLIRPQLARLFAPIRRAGKLVVLHSCGDISLFLDDLIEIGLDGYQTVQPEVYDFAQLKRRYGDRLTFWGGISTQTTLPFGAPDDVRAAARRAAATLGAGGGWIAGPTHRITADTPVANVVALVEELKALR